MFSHTWRFPDLCLRWKKYTLNTQKINIKNNNNNRVHRIWPDTYLGLTCCSAALLLSSSSLRLASSSWVRGLGAGLGGIAGSWMKGWEGWTWVDDEPGIAVDTEEGLRSCAETQGCTAPGRSTEAGRGDSLLVPVLLELLVLPLKKQENCLH